jgi:hypothetical protein
MAKSMNKSKPLRGASLLALPPISILAPFSSHSAFITPRPPGQIWCLIKMLFSIIESFKTLRKTETGYIKLE